MKKQLVMPLSEKQLEDMYEASLKSSIDISHISKQLDKGDKTFGKHEERITQVEKEQSLLKGKIGAFVLFLTLCVTIMVYGVGWLLSYLFGCKGGP